MATNYEINYDDERFKTVESEKQTALNEIDTTYGNMISESDKYFSDQIEASKQWADKQSQIQQEQTDFAIQQIEQQKEQAKKDYVKEQSGAYVDWQKQSNAYGAEAEQRAASGLTNTGYSESSMVSMYNTYQNRVSTARESYNTAVLNYNNAITEARLQNSSILAEIAYEALQKELELSLQGFQYKNQLVLEQANKKLEVDQMYYNRYQDVLDQINTENALAEEVRQFNESLAEEQRQYDQDMAYRYASLYSSGSGGSSGSSGSGGSTTKTTFRNETIGKDGSDIKGANKTTVDESAYEYLNKLIASGASKEKVSVEIAEAQRKGEITAVQAAQLKRTFAPRGLTY